MEPVDSGRVSQPPGAHERWEKGREWSGGQTEMSCIQAGHLTMQNLLLAYKGTCVFFFFYATWVTRGYFGRCAFFLTYWKHNTSCMRWDSAELYLIWSSWQVCELCLSFQFYGWKQDSDRLNVSISGRRRTLTHASPPAEILNGFSMLPSWKVTTEIDRQNRCYRDLVRPPAITQDQENLAEMTGNQSLSRNHVYCWSNNTCLALNRVISE